MKRLLLLTICITMVASAGAQDDVRSRLFNATDTVLERARAAEAELLAPETFARALEVYAGAAEDFARGRSIERIRIALDQTTELATAATEAAESAKVTLASLIKTRDDATAANAATFAGELWAGAEETFDAAARRLESGDIRGARSRADEAEALYRDAELTAIKAQYLSQTRALLAQAEQLRVPRYAPKTFARAQELLAQAETELNANRYDTDLPRSLAQQANYEARHAIYLAEQIISMDESDLSQEDVILRYEEPLTQIAAAADKVAALDNGTDPVVAELVAYIEELRESSQQVQLDFETSRTRIAELDEEIRNLDTQLGGVSQERVALVQRLEAEARIRDQFTSIEQIFTREEARVSREENAIVIRLVGLTFATGSATVAPAHRPLLEKVQQAAAVFPRAQIVIEGHTDSYGSDDTNMRLSQQRAEAVSAYLSSELGVPSFRMSAVGYGETRPIANNETSQGRERNRRIDVRIEPQLE
jgi:outer membrane protein OmpA-like peptidoglycan-associated protein